MIQLSNRREHSRRCSLKILASSTLAAFVREWFTSSYIPLAKLTKEALGSNCLAMPCSPAGAMFHLTAEDTN